MAVVAVVVDRVGVGRLLGQKSADGGDTASANALTAAPRRCVRVMTRVTAISTLPVARPLAAARPALIAMQAMCASATPERRCLHCISFTKQKGFFATGASVSPSAVRRRPTRADSD